MKNVTNINTLRPLESFSKILLPLDGSELSLSSVPTARAMALLDHAEVIVLNCIDPGDLLGEGGLESSAHSIIRNISEMEKEQNSHLDEVVKTLESSGVRARKIIAKGKPVERILEIASRENINLIVMASNGRTGFRRWMMGSVTEGVLRRAECHILVVPCQNK